MIAKCCILGLLIAVFDAGIVTGQATVGATPATQGSTPGTKPLVFEVVSIRENITPQTVLKFGPTKDGYRTLDVSLLMALTTAYVPQIGSASYNIHDQIKGMPDWLMHLHYDIDARIADQDREQWQKPETQRTMLQVMLQAMLVDRCKLVVHRDVEQGAVYSMVVARSGLKVKATDPAVDHPGGITLPYGGQLVVSLTDGALTMNLYGAPMTSLATFLSNFSNVGRPIQDKTGLTGRYDILLKFPASSESPSEMSASDPGGNSTATVLNTLGLKLQSAVGPVETLVIDHIERPSEN